MTLSAAKAIAPRPYRLVATFGIVAFLLGFPIIGTTAAYVHAIDAAHHSARLEARGSRYVQAVITVLRRAQRYRIDLAARGGTGDPTAAARAASEEPALTTAIEAIEDHQPSAQALNVAIGPAYTTLVQRWKTFLAQRDRAFADLSPTTDAAFALLTAISDHSGITYDPSVDALNLGDAMTARFPVARELALRAALLAQTAGAGHDRSLTDRFAVARLLAQAQALIAMGVADVSDAVAENPAIAYPLKGQSDRDKAAFAALDREINARYVEGGVPDAVFDAGPNFRERRDTVTRVTATVVDTLLTDFDRALNARFAQLEAARKRTIAAGVGALLLDAVVMMGLAQITIRRYRSALRRAAATHAALKARLAHADAERALLLATAQFRAVFDRAPQGMILVDRNGKVLDANDAAQSMVILSRSGSSVPALIAQHRRTIDDLFAGRIDTYATELKFTEAGKPAHWIEFTISLVHDDNGQALFAIAVVHDISDRKAMEDRLIFDATHDPLTGLPNRKLFIDVLQSAIDRRVTDPRTFCVLFVDFNDFKTINDSLGHSAGDHFLIGAAKRLGAALRAGDVVARLGGDEFGILLYEDPGDSAASIDAAVSRLQQAASTGIEIDGLPVATSASFGVALGSAHYRRADEMLRDADTAMYAAKSQGTRSHVVFDQLMRERVVRRMQLASDLARAVSGEEFELLYQPIVALADGRVVGCEALIRWRRPADGIIIPPADFIPLAEEGGTIVEIGRWVMATACDQLRRWEQTHLDDEREFTMHVNLAVPEVYHRDIAAELKRALALAGVRADRVMLEITESTVLENTPRTRETLADLKGLGLSLCIDDFGTGYSSLRYLHQLPLHGFKIDRAFVGGAGGLANAAIVEMLLILGRSLGLEVIAEGIETQQQWRALHELGCRYGQGFLFAPPLEADAFVALLAQTYRALPPEALSAPA